MTLEQRKNLGTVEVPVKFWKDAGDLKSELVQFALSVLVAVLMAWLDSGEPIGQFALGASLMAAVKSALLAYFAAKRGDVITGLQHFDGPPTKPNGADGSEP